MRREKNITKETVPKREQRHEDGDTNEGEKEGDKEVTKKVKKRKKMEGRNKETEKMNLRNYFGCCFLELHIRILSVGRRKGWWW